MYSLTELSDVDECQEVLHNCSTNASCINIDGSFDCLCYVGYSGDCTGNVIA